MRVSATLILALALTSTAIWAKAPPAPGVATAATADANRKVAALLPLGDQQDFRDSRRGRLAQVEGGIIRNAKGEVVWDANSYAFLNGPAPVSVNPSLWRQSQLNAEHGLFEVTPGIYQFRGYDIAVMTIIQGKSGWIIVDPLSSVESAAVGLALVNKTLGSRPVSGIVFTHSHTDHFGGVAGIASPDMLRNGTIPILAPHGFLSEAVSENVLAGPAMGRRATFQFGVGLKRDIDGQVGTGLGQALPANSTSSLAKPTMEVTAGQAPIVIDGITFNFIDAAHSEAPAEFMFYLPDFEALCSSEVATGTLHNVLTQRGAKVRDTLGWSKAIDKALRLYGDSAKLVFGSHNWPRWGNARVRNYLEHHRDAYRFLHDQTLRRANGGGTPVEIAEDIGEPDFAKTDFSVRGYYGTQNHNSKAVYQHYFGWWDGVPANYNPHPPVDEAKRYVTAMGGPKKALTVGIKAFEAGDYRWSSRLFQHLVFADPTNKLTRDWLAASYEQQGFQAESGAWRNYFLRAAKELRDGDTVQNPIRVNAAYLGAIPTTSLFDNLSARIIPAKITMPGSTIRFDFTDRNEVITLHVGQSVVFPRMDDALATPTVKLTMARAVFDKILAQEKSFPDAVKAGDIKVEGDIRAFATFFQALDTTPSNFNVVTP